MSLKSSLYAKTINFHKKVKVIVISKGSGLSTCSASVTLGTYSPLPVRPRSAPRAACQAADIEHDTKTIIIM